MMDRLNMVIRTPREIVLDMELDGVRVPTETGQIGLRPRQEPLVVSVEPGLVLLHDGDRTRFAATAGGLLEGDRRGVVLYTPFAVVGERQRELADALDRVLSLPDAELDARRRLGELEQRIVRTLRERDAVSPLPRSRGTT
ncbi:MAG: hypothetical protein KDC38_06350 [Planctomycetes bacterium]|nr:hypothetical protein [Planctomycetota bacterium]